MSLERLSKKLRIIQLNMGTMNKELRLINKMEQWIIDVGEDTLINGRTIINVMKRFAEELNTSHNTA